MDVKIKLYTILRKYANGKIDEENSIVLNEDATLQALINYH